MLSILLIKTGKKGDSSSANVNSISPWERRKPILKINYNALFPLKISRNCKRNV
jgi:hypothetical protein